MNKLMKLAAVSVTLSLAVLAGCATGHVDPADRDTTGAYDGVWIGSVAGPRASTVLLPGKWQMSCDWEAHEVYLTVDDGRVRLGKLEGKTPVSSKGDFRIDLSSGPAGMSSGIMSGTGEFVHIFSGNFSGSEPNGNYAQLITSIGTRGCSSVLQLRRASNQAS